METEPAVKLRKLEICYRHLRYVANPSLAKLQCYTYLKDVLWSDVFGFRDHPLGGMAPPRPGGPGAEVWVFAHAARLGAESFWKAWWPTCPGLQNTPQTLSSIMTADWEAKHTNVRAFERPSIETIHHQVICMKDQVGRNAFPGDRDGGFAHAYSPPESTAADEPKRLTEEEGERPPPMVFDDLPFLQKLDWDVFASSPSPNTFSSRV